MKKVLVLISAALFILNLSAVAGAVLVNGDFETGDLSGWTLGGGAGGSAAAVTSITNLADGSQFFPQHGTYFAVVTGAPSTSVFLDQSLTLNAGDKLSGYASLDSSSGYGGEYASVTISGNQVWSLDVAALQGNYGGLVLWQAWEWTAPAAGTYNLDLGVTIQAADGGISRGYFDYNVLTAVPVPGPVWLLGSGFLGLIGWRTRKHN